MRKIFAILVVTLSFGFANEIKPSHSLETKSIATDILVDNKLLYAGTYGGVVEVFNLSTKKLVKKISLPMITDFMDDEVMPKIYAIDKFKDQILIVSEGRSGYRNLHVHDGKKLKLIIDFKNEFLIKKALFVDKDHILIGLFNSEIILYKISKSKIIHRQATKDNKNNDSILSDMSLSEDKKRLVTADKNGEINVFTVKKFKHIRLLSGQNEANIHKIDYKKEMIITAGEDGRCAVYKNDDNNDSNYFIDAKLPINAVAIAPSGNVGAFASLENSLQIFDTKTKNFKFLLKGHNAAITDVLFVNDSEIISSAEEKNIIFWDINKSTN
jgi:WD40 repeat protein